MQAYRRSLIGLFLVFCIYTPVAVIGGLRGGEFFPAFNWSLFTHVKRHHLTTEIEIIRLGDRVFDPPRRYFSLKSEFRGARAQDVTLWKTLIRYRRAVDEGAGDADAIRRQIEAAYLRHSEDVEYRIVTSWFDVLDRYRTGAVLASVDMGRFEVQAAK